MDSCQDAVNYVSEYLHRIGSITLVVHLEKGYAPLCVKFPPHTSQTIQLFFRRDGNGSRLSRKIKLPREFHPQFEGKEVSLDSPDSGFVQLSIRALPIVKSQPEELLDEGQLFTPWPTTSLKQLALTKSHFACSQCHETLLTCENIKSWKALPTETWAEMMDFWHCHKPSGPGSESSFNTNYTISAFHAFPNTAMVGNCYVLFHPSQFVSAHVHASKANNSGSQTQVIVCAHCSFWLGYQDFPDTCKIYKWALEISSPVEIPRQYPGHLYVSATINELIKSHGVYTFSISPEDYSVKHESLVVSRSEVLIWVFNPDFQYCTNTTSGDIDSGMKVFYSSDPVMIPKLKQTRGDVEQLHFPSLVVDELLLHLSKHALLYPKDSQKMTKDWKMSILHRL